MASPATIGRYELTGEVARGGMGAVFRARSPEGAVVAVKVLLAGRDANAHQRRRVATEVQSLLRLRHETVVALLDAGEHHGAPFLVMEWVEGRTLADRLAREGPLEPPAAVELVRRLAAAVEHCHAQGVLHRDLKPENVLLRAADGAPLLTDFGLSRDVDVDASGSRATRTGHWLGTPGYWPPEQARGELSAIGPRSDVYGLGAILYAALTGAPPQEGSLQELLGRREPPAPPSRRRRGVPGWLDGVCLRALALEPERRHASAAELERALSRGGGAAGLAGSSRPWGAARGAVAVVLLGGAVAAAIALGGRGRPGQPKERSTGPVESMVAPARVTTAVAAPPPVERSDPAGAMRAMRAAADHMLEGDDAQARAEIERAIALDPRCGLAYSGRGALRAAAIPPVELSRSNPEALAALADLDRGLELEPGNPAGLAARGWLRMSLDDLPGAVEDLERAVAGDPGQSVAWTHLAEALQRLDRLDEALRAANEAVLRAREDPEAWGVRASIFDRLDRPAEALRDVGRALELAPDAQPALRLLRGKLRLRQRQFAAAKADLEQGAREGLIADRELNVALISACMGVFDLGGARAASDRILATAPDDVVALVARAEVGTLQQDLAGARADLDRALALDPRHADAWTARGRLRREAGDGAGARADLDRAVELEPRSAPTRITRGLLRQEQGDLAGARADLDLAIELDPTLASAWRTRGSLRAEQGDVAGARADLDRALELDPRLATAWRARGLLRRAADPQGAIADLRRFLELAGSSDPAAVEVRRELERLSGAAGE